MRILHLWPTQRVCRITPKQNICAIFRGLFTPPYHPIVACGAFSTGIFFCIFHKMFFADLFYRLNEKISRSVAIGWIDLVVPISNMYLFAQRSNQVTLWPEDTRTLPEYSSAQSDPSVLPYTLTAGMHHWKRRPEVVSGVLVYR